MASNKPPFPLFSSGAGGEMGRGNRKALEPLTLKVSTLFILYKNTVNKYCHPKINSIACVFLWFHIYPISIHICRSVFLLNILNCIQNIFMRLCDPKHWHYTSACCALYHEMLFWEPLYSTSDSLI